MPVARGVATLMKMRHVWRLLVIVAGLLPWLPVGAAPWLPPHTRLVAGDPDTGNLTLTLLVKGATLEALTRAGVTARLKVGNTWVVGAPVTALRRLRELPEVSVVDAGHRLRPLLDRSGPVVGAPAARARFRVSGRDTIVGVVDTGIDTRHLDFRNADGTTRILYVLDLSLPPTGNHPLLEDAYGGAVFDSTDINGWLASGDEPPTVDTYGHGTHVAGIAVGDGAGTRPGSPAGRYVGMAPGAGLVVVKASRTPTNVFSDGDVILGVQFIFDIGRQLDLPAVANLSLGGQGGAHDGSSTLEQVLSDLVAHDPPGRSIVVAAGNDGAADMHASGALRRGGTATVGLEILDYHPHEGLDELVTLEVWYPAGSDLAVTLASPNGERFGPVRAGSRLDEDSPDGYVTIDVDERHGDGARSNAVVRLRKIGDHTPAIGKWRLTLDGTARRWDVWVVEDTLGNRGAALVTSHLDPDLSLAIPALAERLIAVGSFVSRNSWITVDGSQVTRGSVPGRPSWFSAAGPTADGRLKPDLVAPGDFVVSSLSEEAYPVRATSAFYVAGEPRYLWGDDGVHGVLRGTSQAAPHVAGAIALLWELSPDLRPSQLRELLRLSARTDELTTAGHRFSPKVGFGKLDIGTAMRLLQGAAPGPPSPSLSLVGVARDLLPPASGATTRVVVVPKDLLGLPVGPGHAVALETTAGSFSGPVFDAGTGRYERALRAGPRGEVATITATVDGVPLESQPRVWFVDRRDEIGAPLHAAGGGCATPAAASRHPTMGQAIPPTLLLLLLALGRPSRRREPPGRTSYRSSSCSRKAK